MALTEEAKNYILQAIFDSFNGDPVAFQNYLTVTKANVQLAQLQAQLTSLESDQRQTMQTYAGQRQTILNQINALYNV